jgi:hypothetical protein
MGRQSKWEYFRSVYARYRQAAREVKRKILDEFCANTSYNRKYALRLLNGPPPVGPGSTPTTRRDDGLPMARSWCRC